MSIGLLRLKGRMRRYGSSWSHTYLSNRVLLIFVAIVFAALNLVVMVITALPRDPGKIPRFYWPVALVGLAGFGILYWGFLRLFQSNTSNGGYRLGSKIGFHIFVYEQGDDVPDEMKFPMLEAVLDGSRRRLQYKVRYARGLMRPRLILM